MKKTERKKSDREEEEKHEDGKDNAQKRKKNCDNTWEDGKM